MSPVRCIALGFALCLLQCSSDSPTTSSGGQWVIQTSGTTLDLHSVWGNRPDNVYAVGAQGMILHFDGVAWTQEPTNTSSYLWAVSGLSDSDIYAVGSFATILHYDGTSWTKMSNPFSQILSSVLEVAPDDIYVGGEILLHYNGSAWHLTSAQFPGFVTGLSGGNMRLGPQVDTSFGYLAILLAGGTMYLDDGLGWGEMQPGYYPGANGFWLSSWSDIFFVAGDKVVRGGKGHWTESVSPGATALQAIDGPSSYDLFAVGKGMIHYDGKQWSTVSIPTSFDLYDVWVSSADCGFAVGRSGTILRLQR